MSKPKTNYFVDFLILLSFLVTAATGLVMNFFLPSGVRQGGYQEFLGISKKIWSGVHDWSGIIFIGLVLLHVILHWGWIVCMTKNIFKSEPEKCER